MNQFQKKEIIQAVLIADNNVEYLQPLSNETSTSLLPLVNVPLLDYALESLNRSGIEEVFIFSSLFINDVRNHVKRRIESQCSWSVNMKVNIIGAEGCQCLGDALRDLDAKGLIRGYFVLMGADTVTNVNLIPILERHKKTAKFDKGTSLTIILKRDSSKLRTGDQVVIAMDAENNRLHFHQRVKQNSKENNFKIPLEVFLNNSNVALHHNLIDPQIAICSPSFLSLFSDNFDFENRDDFIRGLLMNEEILDSRIYVHLLQNEQYARKITNWITYQILSYDVINRWAYPLVPDMGICCLWQNYYFLRNNIYKSPKANVSKAQMKDNIVIQEGSSIDNDSEIANVVIGKNCKIGKNCFLQNSYLFDNVIIEDNCVLEHCVVGSNVQIGTKSKLCEGTVIGSNVIIPANSNLSGKLLQCNEDDNDETEKIGNKAYIINNENKLNTIDSDDEQIEIPKISIPKMTKLPLNDVDSDYISTGSEEEESRVVSPVQDDSNIFLSEVIDSLARGFQEKSNPDFLILEINSSRYAYNMTLKEVNFYVIKAIFSLPHIKENANEGAKILQNLYQILKCFGKIIENYIKTKDAMLDCLSAIEECLNEEEKFKEKATQIIHYFYDKEFINEDAILVWYENLPEESEWLKKNLTKFIEWLMASSEEESSEEEEEE